MRQKINEELPFLLPNEVKEMNLPPKSNEIYGKFRGMSDKDGWCYSTIEGLAKELNCSKTTIMLNLKILENKKIILERVVGKKGTASRFKINKFNDSTESSTECSTECSTESSTECSTECSTEYSTELKTFIEEVITLKMNELKNDIILELRNLLNNDSTEFSNAGTLKENKRKEIKINKNKLKEIKIKQTNNIDTNTNSSNNTDIDNNLNNIENIEINKKENIDLNINESIDKSTCMYKRRKQNDYQFTVEEKYDYNPIVENTKVEGVVSKSDGNTSKSKKFFYSLKDSSITFSSWLEAQEYSRKHNLNFDECFKKVEVLV